MLCVGFVPNRRPIFIWVEPSKAILKVPSINTIQILCVRFAKSLGCVPHIANAGIGGREIHIPINEPVNLMSWTPAANVSCSVANSYSEVALGREPFMRWQHAEA